VSTTVKRFNFNTDLENWVFDAGGGSGLTATRNTSENSPNDTEPGTGNLQVNRYGRNKANGSPVWNWGATGLLTWEDLGVPAGDVVTAVNLAYDWCCSEYNVGVTSDMGSAQLRTGGGTLRGNFSVIENYSSTTSWATKPGNALGPFTDPSNTAVWLQIWDNPKTGNDAAASVTARIDWIVVTITHNTPQGMPNSLMLMGVGR